ncbi:MAG: YggT family protein [Hydrogenophilales bacterium]|nr:YggT family protein [Hydrogenophilales bacterium]
MLQDAGQFLLQVFFELFASAFWLRFYMQWARVSFRNPFAQFIVKVTDFAVRPVRRVIPGWFGLDLASLLLFFLAEWLMVMATHWLMGYPFAAAGFQVLPGISLMALASALRLAIYICMGLVLIQAVMSWINPFSPYASVFYALTQPLLGPFQRIIPSIGGVDLSPLAVFILMQLVLIAPVAGLERYARGLVW